MLNNLKLIGIVFLAFLLLTNCKKENKVDETIQTSEVVFSVLDKNIEKTIDCNSWVPSYVRVIIDGTTYEPEIFELGGVIYTQTLQLPVGPNEITEFTLRDEFDHIVKATPNTGFEFDEFVTISLPYSFTVTAFIKTELEMEVLCFEETTYTDFGFEWFVVTEMTIREQCFFGDLCIKDINQYTGSLYGPAVTIDERAIFMIKTFVKVDGIWVVSGDGDYNNFVNGDYINDGFGNYIPLCVPYADYDVGVDEFKFELWVYVTSGELWGYVKFHEWFFADDEQIEDQTAFTDDGVVDFVIGNCVSTPTDLLLPPWMNLPGGITYDLSYPGANSYWDVTISNIPVGNNWDIISGDFKGWCADEGTTIGQGPQCMDAKSSLYPDLLPAFWLNDTPIGGITRKEAIGAANWLWNQVENGAYTGYSTAEMQDALWNLFNNKYLTPGSTADIMAEDAKNHTDFSPLPGGWAAIFFLPCEPYSGPDYQMTFYIVDP